MRAPPPPRRSKSRFVAYYIVRLRRLISCDKLRERWHLHKLHKIHRRGGAIISPISGIRAEDMMNIPTALQPRKSRKKPLLIAAFPKGCSRSPRVRVLQRNRLSKLMISKRKYKLKSLEVHDTSKVNIQVVETHRCANEVGSIKKMTSKNADVKVIYHETNVIKCSNLRLSSAIDSRSPEIFEFAPNKSIRIKDYPSLRNKRPSVLRETQSNILAESPIADSTPESKLSLNLIEKRASEASLSFKSRATRYECSKSNSQRQQFQSKMVKAINFSDCRLISYSRLVIAPDDQATENTLSGIHHLAQN